MATMNAYPAGSGLSSENPSISDLDGFTIARDFPFPAGNFAPTQDSDFGFDPPEHLEAKQEYSPVSLNDMSFTGWPKFEREDDSNNPLDHNSNLPSLDMDKFISQTLPTGSTAVSRYGQMTPPRSNSASSTESQEAEKPASDRRKRSKVATKDIDSTAAITTSSRKRKSTRKSTVSVEPADSPEEAKRKQSLEKNRLAAAKCRVNKKEKTEQLQRDSHNKAVENAFLKNEVMRLQHLAQQMNAYLLAHTNCKGAEDVRRHLNDMGEEFFNHPIAMASDPNFADFQQLPFQDMPVMQDSYFASVNQDPAMLHPPLPEFNRTAEFEVHSPMQTD